MPESEKETVQSASSSLSTQFQSSNLFKINDVSNYNSDTHAQMGLACAQLFSGLNIIPSKELSLKDILTNQAREEKLNSLTEIQLKIISSDICLQHLSIYTPHLQILTLNDSAIASLRELGCGLVNLTILRIDRCGLISLDGIVGFEKLEELYAAHNNVTDLSPCISLTTIKRIDLRKNNLKSIENLSFLSLCSSLQQIEISGNKNITSNNDYRSYIAKILPNIEAVDGKVIKDIIPKHSSNDILVHKTYRQGLVSRHLQNSEPTKSSFIISFPPRILSPKSSSESSSSSDIISNTYS